MSKDILFKLDTFLKQATTTQPQQQGEKIYLKPGEQVPEGVQILEGANGGRYYIAGQHEKQPEQEEQTEGQESQNVMNAKKIAIRVQKVKPVTPEEKHFLVEAIISSELSDKDGVSTEDILRMLITRGLETSDLKILATHSSREVQMSIIRNATGNMEVLSEMLNDSDSYVRYRVAQNLPKDKLYLLKDDKDDEVRLEVARGMNPEDLHMMMQDPALAVRRRVVERIDPAELPKMIGDKSNYIRLNVARRLAPEFLPKMMNDKDITIRIKVAKRISPEYLHQMIRDEDSGVREQVASRIDEDGMLKMINDESPSVRRELAERLSPKHLHHFINDEYENIRNAVAKRIDQNGLHKMIKDKSVYVRATVAEKIDQSGLEKMVGDMGVINTVAKRLDYRKLNLLKDDTGDYLNDTVVAKRKKNVETITPEVLEHFRTHKELPEKLPDSLANYIKDWNTDVGIAKASKPIFEELYRATPFSSFYNESVEQWESSASSKWGGVIKSVVGELFDGKVKHHKGNLEEDLNTIFSQYDPETVKEFAKAHHQITQKFLDIMYPNQDSITIYRGTTKDEIKDFGNPNRSGNIARVRQNPVSSWTLKKEVASNFAKSGQGVVMRTTVPKHEIWSTFLSHAYEGNEKEILLIGKDERDVEIISGLDADEE